MGSALGRPRGRGFSPPHENGILTVFDIAEHRFMKHKPDARAGQEGPASLRIMKRGGYAARFARLHCRAVRIRYLAAAASSDLS